LQERVGIAGSGAIACGLAATAARAGEVLLWARSERSADRARAMVANVCAKVDGEALDPSRVQILTELEGLADATFVVEAVIEDHDHKASLLAELAMHTSDQAVLATTTSSLTIATLARATGRPERFVGFHVFNPVPRMKLVELVFPDEALDQTRTRARELCEELDKTAVEVPDIPGFVVNRLLFPYLFSAVELLEATGMTPADVDSCMTLGAGLPMGPIALLDFVGLDVAQAIGEALETAVPDAIRTRVDAGACGRKSGRGFYSYE
jgi:3-hydroxybutyryl-CoA dehydrogenase